MKNILRHSILVAAIVGLLAAPAAAQKYTISNTTLDGAINATQTTLVLTSASASTGSSFGAPAAGQCMFIDGELMRIVSMASTTATVTRSPYTPTAHPTLAVVWTAPCNAFYTTDPPVPSNAANANNLCSTQMPAPWINTSNGNIWWCNTTTNKFYGTNYMPITYNSVPTGQ